MGLAYVMSLSHPTFWNDAERKNVFNELTAIYEVVGRRQSSQGGWSSYQTSYNKPTAFAGYATDMALLFLLQLKQSKLLQIDDKVVDQKITNSLYWILKEYSSGLIGWEDGKGEGLHEDLTTMHLLLLTMAKRYGFKLVGSDGRYLEARKRWLQRTWKNTKNSERKVSDISRARQKQELFDANGTLIGEHDVSVGLVWYPWTLLLASYLNDDQDLVEDEKKNSSQILATLWPKLTTLVDEVSSGATYRVAETLYVLGTIRRGL